MDQAIGSVLAVGSQQSLTERLSHYWSGARYEDLPEPVVAMAKSVLLDTLSVGVRGAESEAATRKGIAKALECSTGSASIWGTRSSLPPSAAALVNGTASHAYEYDDFGGCGHSGAVVVPAVCAMAERVHADGRSVLVALAAGYDVTARVTQGAGHGAQGRKVERRSGPRKLDRPISGRTAPIEVVFYRSRDDETTQKEPQCGVQGQGGAGGIAW